ncbi:aminoglycoside 3'-phosphotransferase/choline kinase family protein [Cereibacter sphaeroides]|nr:aminoglycoside 3'-phosphotransferase/choline kinase family protein [Cereibacter sphaeroides]
MIPFPHEIDEDTFEHWRIDPALWGPVAQALAATLGFPVHEPKAFRTGTNLVVDLNGTVILKLFPPFYRAQYEVERLALRQLEGRLTLPIPRIQAEGARDGWSWLVISKLEGVAGSEVWPDLTDRERLRILQQIGRAIAEVQAVDPGPLAALCPSWPDFLARQAESCLARHHRQGLAPRFLAEIPALLASGPAVLPPVERPVILTGEWVPENLLLSHGPDGWELTALIDFGDVLVGPGDYDLLGPSCFICCGVPERLSALLAGFGSAAPVLDHALRQRLLLLMMLHRASDLRNIAIEGWEAKVSGLDELSLLLWPSI